MAQILERTVPWIPGSLVDGNALARLRTLTRHFPAPLSSRFYLECRLGPGTARTDLILGLEQPGVDILTERNPALRLAPQLQANPIWRGIRSLLCQLTAEQRAAMQRLWLEFDLDTSPSEVPVPGAFVDWHRPIPSRDAESAAWPWIVGMRSHLGLLLGDTEQERALRSQWQRCLSSLPEGARIFSVGYFPSRFRQQIRVCFTGLPQQMIPSYVAALGWNASAEPLCAWLTPNTSDSRTVDESSSNAVLHLDIDGDRLSRLGIEIGVPGKGLDHQRLENNPHLRRLIQMGLCTPWKRRGLAAWPGGQVETLPHQLWPSRVVRWVNHLKVVMSSDGEAEAKAYLCQSHVPHEKRRQSRP